MKPAFDSPWIPSSACKDAGRAMNAVRYILVDWKAVEEQHLQYIRENIAMSRKRAEKAA